MRNGQVSHWMFNSDATAYPELQTSESFDVCIVGGGLTGLWAAYHLTCLAPSLQVAVLEAKHVGYGASGRNGGWASHLLPGKPMTYAQTSRFGVEGVRRLQRALVQSIDSIEEICEREGIDAELRRVGTSSSLEGRPRGIVCRPVIGRNDFSESRMPRRAC